MPARSSKPRPLSTVLIANRGEIAVRIARACRDAGLRSVAVYADPDRDALHTQVADDAYALGGTTAASSYLVVDKIMDIAHRSGADAIHPGYGFLSERADLAQAVIDAGLTWLGTPTAEYEKLGDKFSARHIAQKAGAPLVAGTKDPVKNSDEVVDFARANGLPIAIKAAFGGGGRGLKVAREESEVRELFDSAVREAIAAFGRGECFVERYLDAPRPVGTQCPAGAPAPGACRGAAPAPPRRPAERPAGPPRHGDPAGGRLRRRRHLRVPGGPRRHHLLPRGQHPPAGRAPGDRGGRGRGPGAREAADRR